MIEDVVATPRRTWWTALRLLLVALWVVAAALSWWTAPRKASFDQAVQAVDSGRMTAYQWGSGWDGNALGTGPQSGASRWFGASPLTSSSPLGPVFAWRTSDGRVHWADATDFEQVTLTKPVDSTYVDAGAQFIGDRIKDRSLEDEVVPYGGVIGGIGIALFITFLSVLLAGPAPVRGTKWFWWCIVTLLPYGLGLLVWMARDRPWTPAAERIPRTLGADPRDRGWAGLGLGLLGSVLVAALIWGLSHILGPRWIPVRNG